MPAVSYGIQWKSNDIEPPQYLASKQVEIRNNFYVYKKKIFTFSWTFD